MNSYLDCIPCFFSQALRAARIATNDEATHKRILDRIAQMVKIISLEDSPPKVAGMIYRIIAEETNNPDPYKHIKRDFTRRALDLLPSLRKQVLSSDEPMMTAIRYAITGNIIDFGPTESFNMEKALDNALLMKFGICDYETFREHALRSKKTLYIGDNAGETVFDRLLIEQLDSDVTYAVRNNPVINDATIEDAREAGLDEAATIMSSGCDAPGIILEECSRDFRDEFESADLVIAKGQGNYESLSDVTRPMFFLLKAKCAIIARDLGITNGDIVLKGINAQQRMV